MTPRRGTAVAIALLLAALAIAGCGLGSGDSLEGVRLTVTRDYGSEILIDRGIDDVTEADTVMRVLDRSADISTSYGGDFVDSIDGIEGTQRSGRYFDWLFYVNGVEATVGAGAYELHGGERIWWDYRDWTSALHLPAVVGAWPQPFLDGYDGKRWPIAVECMGEEEACAETRRRLEEVGADIAAGEPAGAIRVLVGPWARVREDPAAAQIEDGPQASGVFADFVRRRGGFELRGLGADGRSARTFGSGAGLVAATRRYDAPPVWVVTGARAAGVRAAARLLNAANLRDHYAVATDGGGEASLPVGS